MGIYSVDYTQDFSGTLDREALVESLEHLGLVRQDDGGEREGTILENTHSVGEHVCTWVRNGKRTKIYNKIVPPTSKLEKYKRPMGAKLAEYVDCPNEHLRKTFHHPEVQKRGCTRVEISVYGRDFSHRTYQCYCRNFGTAAEHIRSTAAKAIVEQPSKAPRQMHGLLLQGDAGDIPCLVLPCEDRTRCRSTCARKSRKVGRVCSMDYGGVWLP